jgi:hypothetical protein
VSGGKTNTGRIDAGEIHREGKAAALPWMVQALAGPFAERKINDQAFEYEVHRQDHDDALRIAAIATCKMTKKPNGDMWVPPEVIERNTDRIEVLRMRALKLACDLVERHFAAIEAVANLLLTKRELTGEQVAAIVNG